MAKTLNWSLQEMFMLLKTGKGPFSFEYRFFKYIAAAFNVKHVQMLSCTNKFKVIIGQDYGSCSVNSR